MSRLCVTDPDAVPSLAADRIEDAEGLGGGRIDQIHHNHDQRQQAVVISEETSINRLTVQNEVYSISVVMRSPLAGAPS